MRISTAQVQMSSAHHAVVQHDVRQRLALVVPGAVAAPTDAVDLSGATRPKLAEIQSIRSGATQTPATAARAALRANLQAALAGESRPHTLAPPKSVRTQAAVSHIEATGAAREADGPASKDDLKTAVVKALFEQLTGHKMTIDPKALEAKLSQGAQRAADATDQMANQLMSPAPEAAGLAGDVQLPGPVAGIQFDQIETTQDSESVAVSARATIATEDGQTIQVGVDMALSRSFVEENRISLTTDASAASGQASDAANAPKSKDPLVLNFDAPAASLTAGRVAFDVDSDGTADQVHFVGQGSGFVALDKNGNGKIDNGSELFGAKSGDGFQELAAYDGDANGFIDENDAVFGSLKIWSKDAAGADSLKGLKEHGVGAIYLGKVTAPYSYKGQDNETVATMRSAGFYVGEAGGRAGSMQQLDLVV